MTKTYAFLLAILQFWFRNVKCHSLVFVFAVWKALDFEKLEMPREQKFELNHWPFVHFWFRNLKFHSKLIVITISESRVSLRKYRVPGFPEDKNRKSNNQFYSLRTNFQPKE